MFLIAFISFLSPLDRPCCQTIRKDMQPRVGIESKTPPKLPFNGILISMLYVCLVSVRARARVRVRK